MANGTEEVVAMKLSSLGAGVLAGRTLGRGGGEGVEVSD